MTKNFFMIAMLAVCLCTAGTGKVANADGTVTESKTEQSKTETVKQEERTKVYLYHPRKLVLDDSTAKVAFWYSSDSEVVKVSSDGIVEACREGNAEVTAYDKSGNPLQTYYLHATTVADANPLSASLDNPFEYTKIRFEDVQEKINTITDYAYWLYANNVYYDGYQEATNPMGCFIGEALWMQMANADWIFKNHSGICCTVAAGGMYALVGDYEENGLIFMSGPYGHVISYFKENGQYIVVDFTRNISDGQRGVNEMFGGNVPEYVKAGIGTGATVKEAFYNYLDHVGSSFYLDNYLIYAVDLTGLDYYPAEANNWCQGKDFFKGPNRLYVVKGTEIDTLCLAEGIEFEVVEMNREEIPGMMEIVTEATDVSSTETCTLLGVVPVLEPKIKYPLTTQKFNVEKLGDVTALTQEEFYDVIHLSSGTKESFSDKVTGKEAVYLYHPKKLEIKTTGSIAFWYSSAPNVLRVASDGTVTAYSEGVADVYACGYDGTILEKYSLYATTYADKAPLDATLGGGSVETYRNLYYEDIPEKLNTITDFTAWMYANGLIYDGAREPMPPSRGYANYGSTSPTEWMQMANSNWVFKDYAGICCNAAAGALYALEGDYEKYGLIFMTGPYGHVINYYMENGTWYVVDYTAVYGGGEISWQFANNPEAYIKSKCGIGATLMDAFQNYIDKGSGDFYYENYIIYAMDLTGLNYYPAECNNWFSDTYDEIFRRDNTLFVVEGTPIETIYVHEKITFHVQEVPIETAPAKMQVVVPDRMAK